MPTSAFKLRIQGNVTGPFTKAQVMDFAKQGRIYPHDELSADDGTTWMRISKTSLAALLPGAEPPKPHWPSRPTAGAPKPAADAKSPEPEPERHSLLAPGEDEKDMANDMAGVLPALASVPWPEQPKTGPPRQATPPPAARAKKAGKRPELTAWAVNALWFSLLLVAAACLMVLRMRFKYEHQAAGLITALGACVAHLTLATLCLSKIMDGRNWARFCMLAGVAAGSLWLLWQLAMHRPDCFGSAGMCVATTLGMFAQCLQIGAMVMLFMPESGAWFAGVGAVRSRRAGRQAATDPAARYESRDAAGGRAALLTADQVRKMAAEGRFTPTQVLFDTVTRLPVFVSNIIVAGKAD